MIDLIARQGNWVVFIEVKARRGTAFGSPPEAVTGAKRRELVKAARVWVDRHGRPADVYRFDCIALIDNKLQHRADAFRPGWRYPGLPYTFGPHTGGPQPISRTPLPAAEKECPLPAHVPSKPLNHAI